MRVRSIPCFVLFTLLLTSVWAGDETDLHWKGHPLSPVVHVSAFVHGYLHGYEDGFQIADMDIHMARPERRVQDTRAFSEPGKDYHTAFGNRDNYRSAYRLGLSAGYTDGILRKPFRAIGAIQQVVAGMPAFSDERSSRFLFDNGFVRGFHEGNVRGLKDETILIDFSPITSDCVAKLKANEPQTFCEGFLRGFRFGYNEAFVVRARQIRNQFAKEQSGK